MNVLSDNHNLEKLTVSLYNNEYCNKNPLLIAIKIVNIKLKLFTLND